jgi:hypothetical protein
MFLSLCFRFRCNSRLCRVRFTRKGYASSFKKFSELVYYVEVSNVTSIQTTFPSTFVRLFEAFLEIIFRLFSHCCRRLSSFFCIFFAGRPNLFASCNNTFSKWWEGLRMSCRRVLSSTPVSMGFGNRGGQQGKGTYKLKLTNKYYKLLESSKKVVGPVSTQALVDWRLGEWGDDFSARLVIVDPVWRRVRIPPP